jgi:hypothetical protein
MLPGRMAGSLSGGARGARRGSRDLWGTALGSFFCLRLRARQGPENRTFFHLYEPGLSCLLRTTLLYAILVIDEPARLVIQGTSLSIFSSSVCVFISLAPCLPNLFPIPGAEIVSAYFQGSTPARMYHRKCGEQPLPTACYAIVFKNREKIGPGP